MGELVATKIQVEFRDTDRDVEAAAGRSIAEIFFDEGEPAFRDRERAAVACALQDHAGVVALGGGAVLDDATRESLRDHRVVFLDVGLSDAAERTGLNQARPLLAINPRATLKRMLDERRTFYEAVATATVPTDGRPAAEVAADVLALL